MGHLRELWVKEASTFFRGSPVTQAGRNPNFLLTARSAMKSEQAVQDFTQLGLEHW